jgi:hypothetical protein
LGLDDNFDANVKIKIYFNIDINHLASLHFLLPDHHTFDILSSHPVVLTSYPPPFRPPRAHILTQLPDVKEAPRKDEGHNTARGLGHVRSEDGQTKDRRSSQDRNGHVGRDAIYNAIFDFGGAGSLVSDG